MKGILQQPWDCSKLTRKLLSTTLSTTLSLSATGLSVGAEEGVKPNAQGQTSSVGKVAGTPVPVHQSTLQATQTKKTHDFWRNLMRNRKVAWFAGILDVPTDTIETSNEVKLFCEVPGLDESTLDITVEKDNVTIKGKKEIDTGQKADDFRRIERAYGSFEKTIPLPASIDSESATASLKNGVLTVLLPKSVEAKSEGKKLSIRRE